MRIRLNNSGVGSKDIDPAGGTITAPLRLTGTPTNPLEAVSSSYVLNAASSLAGASVTGVFAAARLPAYTGTELSSSGNGIFTLNNTGVTAGTYAKVTVDNKGRVTGSGVLVSGDIPNLSYTRLVDKPTTLAGYGITDVVSLSGSTMTGSLLLNGVPTDGTHLVSKSYVDTRVEGSAGSAFVTGDVVSKSSATTPTGFLRCNGSVLNRTTYASLFSVIGTIYNKAGSVNSAGKPWVMQYDFNKNQTVDITGWTTGTPLPATHGHSQAIVTSSRVYLLGGYINGAYSSTVYTAPILADGTLGTWTTGTPLPATHAFSQAIVTSSRVYLLGGLINSASSSTVYTAPILADGTLGTWTTGTSLPTTHSHSQAIVTSSRVYLLGGYIDSTSSSTVYTAPIVADGTLGNWTTGTSLPATHTYSQAIVTSSRVYLLGGFINGAYSSTVYTAPILADGTLGTWTTGTSLPTTHRGSQAIVTSSRVYLLGGIIDAAYSSTVYTAPILADGTLGTWATGTPLPATHAFSQAIVTSSRVYLLGGYINGGYSSTVYTAPFSGGFNDYTNYTTRVTTALTDFTLPDTTLDDTVGFYSYIKF